MALIRALRRRPRRLVAYSIVVLCAVAGVARLQATADQASSAAGAARSLSHHFAGVADQASSAAATAQSAAADAQSAASSSGALSAELAGLVRRVSRDERRTCQIQARGLPAGHQLAASMRDIHALLTIPPSPDAPPEAPYIKRLVRDLDGHLAAYLRAERAQPHRRSC